MCEHCDYRIFLSEIDDMLNDDDNRFAFATPTLEGIQTTVSNTEHVTERQKEAIENIRGSKRR